ncbi:MAG: hypothetical protein EBX36_11190 [Planctomycetia bacterium]|nr:hypothetical protein [Planctomycetia bacterium]
MSHGIGFARYLTLVWPGLPWLWLRGNVAGLTLALAFAVAIDVAVLTTWIWSELVDFRLTVALWSATAAIWLFATASAIASFPPPIPRGRDETADTLFVQARDAYLARDWLAAETRLRDLLDIAPTDGEAQLLLGTLLRRVGRLDEAAAALSSLARSDAGGPWRTVTARELERIAVARRATGEDADAGGAPPQGPRTAPDQDARPLPIDQPGGSPPAETVARHRAA